MEAKAVYAFNATTAEELTFPPNAVLKIIDESDKDWYKAELNGREGFVPSNYVQYARPMWYMDVSKEESVSTLMAKNGPSYMHPDGAFIVRPSQNQPGEKSLSVRIGNDVQHFRILRSASHDKYFIWNDQQNFTSVNQMINHYRNTSVTKNGNARLKDLSFPKVYANYDFEARSAEEMSIRRGEVITVLDNTESDWWKGRIDREDGVCQGLFPATYVTPM